MLRRDNQTSLRLKSDAINADRHREWGEEEASKEVSIDDLLEGGKREVDDQEIQEAWVVAEAWTAWWKKFTKKL